MGKYFKLNISNGRFTYYFTPSYCSWVIYIAANTNFLASPLPCVFLTYPMEFLQSCSSVTAFTFFKKKEKIPGEKMACF